MPTATRTEPQAVLPFMNGMLRGLEGSPRETLLGVLHHGAPNPVDPPPEGHRAPELTAALGEVFDRVPAHLRSTLTWDQGPRDGPLRRHRSPHRRAHDLLLRPTRTAAATHQREHQRHSSAAGFPRAPTSTPTPAPTSTESNTHINTMPRRIHYGESAQNVFDIFIQCVQATCATISRRRLVTVRRASLGPHRSLCPRPPATIRTTGPGRRRSLPLRVLRSRRTRWRSCG